MKATINCLPQGLQMELQKCDTQVKQQTGIEETSIASINFTVSFIWDGTVGKFYQPFYPKAP